MKIEYNHEYFDCSVDPDRGYLSSSGPTRGSWKTVLACLKNGLTYAIPGGLLFWLLVRRGAILFPKLIGAAVGGLAGLIGLSVLEMNCPNLDVYHILVWHGGVVVISSAAGALLGATVEYIDRLRSHKVS